MTTRMPPVPPAGRSNKGPGGAEIPLEKDAGHSHSVPEDVAKQGSQGNIKQNTTNQGYQQDR
jgi:hypothetical protein